MTALSLALQGYASFAQTKWATWVRRQQLQDRLPVALAEALSAVQTFVDPVLVGRVDASRWDPERRAWQELSR